MWAPRNATVKRTGYVEQPGPPIMPCQRAVTDDAEADDTASLSEWSNGRVAAMALSFLAPKHHPALLHVLQIVLYVMKVL